MQQTAPAVPPIPAGFEIELDPDTQELDDNMLFGGSPMRIMRLSEAGRAAMTELAGGPIHSTRAGTLARRLTDAGAAHPRPPRRTEPVDLTVIIPVKDRADMLGQCLTALGRRYPAVVVDDASLDPQAVAAVANAHGARLVVREINGGPAAARNTGVAEVSSEFIAFVDSDTLPTGPWIEVLARQLADPLVAAVAPRILAVTGGADSASKFTDASGSLDLGVREARVAPGSRVSYVPTAAIVVRRSALLDISGQDGPFDQQMRVGEDVDFIWRLHSAGWRIRYHPQAQVTHQEPEDWSGLLHRRFVYGTSAAPLAQRHPEAMAPLVLHPWPTLAVAALLARSPILAAAALTGSVLSMRRTLTRERIPPNGVVPAMVRATQQTWLGIGRYTTQFAAPLMIAALVKPGGRSRRRRWGRRLALASLLLGPPITTWRQRRPNLDPARFVLGQLADDVSYGAGVWTGAVKARTTMPLRPSIVWHPLRIDSARRISPSGAASANYTRSWADVHSLFRNRRRSAASS